jgi:hypothetical protein
MSRTATTTATAAAATDVAFRVHCGEYDTPAVRTYDRAFRLMLDTERTGHCTLGGEHTVEMRVDGEWLPAHLGFARLILAARSRATVDTFDGSLVKVAGTWAREVGDAADAVAEAGSPEWVAFLNATPQIEATLTSDGRHAETGRWHIDDRCGGPCPVDQWVRVERWSTAGREFHGFICGDCRGLVQTG